MKERKRWMEGIAEKFLLLRRTLGWFLLGLCFFVAALPPPLSLYLSLEWVWWVFFSRPHLLSVFVAETDKGLGVLS
jgi:hypothetical protein